MLTHLFRTRTCFYSLSCLTFKLMRQFNDPLSFMSKEPKWLIVDLRSSCGLLATRENMLIYRRHKVLVVVIILVLIWNFVNVSGHNDEGPILRQNIDRWIIEMINRTLCGFWNCNLKLILCTFFMHICLSVVRVVATFLVF